MKCNFDLGQNKMVKQISIPLKSKRKSREVQNAPFRPIILFCWTGRYIGQTRSTLHYKFPYVTVHHSRTMGCLTLHYIHASNLRLFEFMVIYSEYAPLIAS